MTNKNALNDAVDAALSTCDARIAQLDQRRRAVNERRRDLIAPEYKTVVAEPKELHHEIALGSVMRRLWLTAGDADVLAGVFTLDAQDFVKRIDDAIARKDGNTHHVFVTVLHEHRMELEARGRAAAFHRRYDAYHGEHREWLRRDEAFRLDGAWRNEAMTADQGWLIRMTCALTGAELPDGLDRGRAHDWLDAHGANLTYRSFL